MSDIALKDGWSRVCFGDVVKLSGERSSNPGKDGFERFVGLDHIDPGHLKIRRWGDVADGTTFTSVFRPGQVLFGKRRAYQRKVAVADFTGVCSGDIYVLEPRNAGLLPELLPFICQTDGFFKHAIGTSAGSLSPRTNWNSLASYEFTLPPLEEQCRVVGVLSAANKATEAIALLRDRLETVEHSLLLDTFGPTPGSSSPHVSVVPLSELAEIRTGLAKGRLPDESTTSRPYLRVANVKDGALDLREMKEIVVESDRISRYLLHHGDVLMTEGGDLDKLGRGTVWQDEVPGCLHQNHVFAVRTDREQLDPWYLAALARSRYGRAYFLSCAKRTSNLASVNKQQIGAFPVPLLPAVEQRRWVATYRSLRTSIAAIEERLALRESARARLRDQLVGR
jgi:type I restriction enzyme, S subunit